MLSHYPIKIGGGILGIGFFPLFYQSLYNREYYLYNSEILFIDATVVSLLRDPLVSKKMVVLKRKVTFCQGDDILQS